jgi:hypothetical protein
VTSNDAAVLVRGVAPVIKEYVDAQFKAFHAMAAQVQELTQRLQALEDRPLPRDGKDGADGLPGAKGDPGTDGRDGAPGDRGADGARGDTGPDGLQGPEGAAGRDGRDGLPGVPGARGDTGPDGKNGAPGLDGKDGRDAVMENLKISYDGRRTVAFCFKDGTPIEGGTLVVPWPMYDFEDPIWRAEKSYAKGDEVVWGGSTYLAREDLIGVKPGQPDPASRAWVLVVKRGQDGRDGKAVK